MALAVLLTALPMHAYVQVLAARATKVDSARKPTANHVKGKPGSPAAKQRAASAKKAPPSKEKTKSVFAGSDKEERGEYLDAYRYYLRQRAYPYDRVDWSAYLRAAEHRDRMPAAQWGEGIGPLSPLGRWEFVGPSQMPPPYNQYFGPGPLSGRVNAAAFASDTTFYVGAAGGGVWKTANGGADWTPLSDKWYSLQVSSIAIDPKNSNVIYVGTGDFHGRLSACGGYAFGIMKSTDGGKTWTNLGRGEFGNSAVSQIVVDPDFSNIVTVATGRAGGAPSGKVWQSRDGGKTWKAVINVLADWSDIVIGATAPNGIPCMYACGHSTGGQVWRSGDRGATWVKLHPPIDRARFQDGLDLAASPTEWNVVYLLVGSELNIFKSETAGDTWKSIKAGFPNGNAAQGANYNWSQFNYDYHISCSTRKDGANDVDVVYVGLIDLVASPDGGSTWIPIGGPTYVDGSAVTHNDQHCLAVNPSNPADMLVGNDGGVYRLTHNAAANTWNFTPLNAKLGITQFYKAGFNPRDDTRMLGGTQDNATPVARGDLGNWNKNVSGGDGSWCAVHPTTPRIQYASSAHLGVLQVTTNTWATQTDIANFLVGGSWVNRFAGDRTAFIAPISLHPKTPDLLYVGTNYLWRYKRTTNAWTPRLGGQQLSSGSYLLCVAPAPSDGKRLYTGSEDGEVWMTTNGGLPRGGVSSWRRIYKGAGSPSQCDRAVTSIAVHPTRPNRVIIGLSGTGTPHVFRCDNTMAAAPVWTNVSGAGATGLPDIPVNAVICDLDDPDNTYYVGTDLGVFLTTDGGATWANATAPLGLPNVHVNDLRIASSTRYLHAATFGRGMWRIKLAAPRGGLVHLILDPTKVKGGANATGTLILDAAAPAGGAEVALQSSDTTAATVPAKVTVAAGQKSATFAVTTAAVAKETEVLISATRGAVTKEAALAITPAIDFTLTLEPATVKGDTNSTGKVRLTDPAPVGGVTISLVSSDAVTAQVPASVSIAEGAKTAAFDIATTPVDAVTNVDITASYVGTVSQTEALTVEPPTLVSVTLNPTTVTGGRSVNGRVTLDAPAPKDGLEITLASDNVAATVAASVKVPAGLKSVSFTVSTRAVAAAANVTITASHGGDNQTAALAVKPPVPVFVTLNPDRVTGGANAVGRVTLNAPAPAGGLVVTLESSLPDVASVPATVTVPAGKKEAAFDITTRAVNVETQVAIRATYDGVTKEAALTVKP